MERIIKAFHYSIDGLRAAYKREKAFRDDVLILILFLPLAIIAPITNLERAILIGSLLLILMAELVNTAIEIVIDRISEEKHELSGMAKDIGSSVVFLALINAAIVWFLVLYS